MNERILSIGSRVNHPEFGKGVIIQVKIDAYLVTFIEYGTRDIALSYNLWEIIDEEEAETDILSYREVERTLVKILRRFSDIQESLDIAPKWRGGLIEFKPGNTNLKSYEMPIDTFLHKIVMVRDRLRVLEQKINSSDLPEDEKISLQQYITRSYGSFTSFNQFFRNEEDKFFGAKE